MAWMLLALAAGCGGAPDTPVGEGLLAEGCPPAGGATARMVGVDAHLEGPDAVGGLGDALLANERAAFVIGAPDGELTWYPYGGIPVDAAALSGCTQQGPDKLQEIGILVGRLDLENPARSVLRAFRADRLEVVADGSDGGPAIVRATGSDDTMWLVEYELIKLDFQGGGGHPRSEPLGLELVVDYILEPGSPVLRAEVTVRNLTDAPQELVLAQLVTFGDTLDTRAAALDDLSFAGFSLGMGVPFLSSTDGEGAYAFGLLDATMSTMNVGGIDIVLDADQVLVDPLDLGAAGGADTDSAAFLVSVAATDGPAATAPLAAANPEPLPGIEVAPLPVGGEVLDAGTGAPVPGATVVVEARVGEDAWEEFDALVTDGEGRFSGELAALDAPDWALRLVPRAEGRDAGEPVEVPAGGDTGLQLLVPPEGLLEVRVTDGEGVPMPARLDLVREEDGRAERHSVVGEATLPLAPGTWTWALSRGFEFEPASGTVTVSEEGVAAIGAALPRVVDTTGWMSVDTHVHSAPSPDSRVAQADQLRNAAAHGLEVVVNTDHEVVASARPALLDAELEPWVVDVTGEEVTASIPEHMTAMPLEPDGSTRGGIVRWYGLDVAELWDAMRARGSEVIVFNHPGYLDLIGWDPLTGEPTLDDPARLGLAPDAELWGWNFDAVEVLNGFANPFTTGNRRFDNWMAFLNLGHPVTPIGCSDDHKGDRVGFPRTWWRSPTDDPAAFRSEDLVEALRGGEVTVGAGAFVTASVAGTGPGGLVEAPGGAVSLEVRVQGISGADVTHVLVLANCSEVAVLEATDPAGVVKLDATVELRLAEDAWLTVLAMGSQPLPMGLPQFDAAQVPRGFTGAIYVDADGDGAFTPPGGRACTYDLSAP